MLVSLFFCAHFSFRKKRVRRSKRNQYHKMYIQLCKQFYCLLFFFKGRGRYFVTSGTALREEISISKNPKTYIRSAAKLACHTIPWVCYPRRNQWLRMALALFCLPLIWLARVVYLLVCVAEGWGGRRGCVYSCAVLGYAMLRYSVSVGVGVMRVSGRCFVALLARRVFIKIVNHIWDRWLWRGRCLVVS